MKPNRFEMSLLVFLTVVPYAAADTWVNSVGNASWGTNANWADGSQPTLNDPATFPTPIPGQSTIVLSVGERASSLTFNDNYTFSLSGNLQLNTGSINVASGKSVTINTPLVGTAGLGKMGSGTLKLAGSNTFTGHVTFPNASGGTLIVGSNTHLGNSANPIDLFSGTLKIDTPSQTFSMSRMITIGALGGTIEFANNPTVTLNAGFATNSNPLSLRGTGTLLLNSTSNRSGNTYIYDCTVRMNNSEGLGSGGVVVDSDTVVGGIGKLEIPDGINFIRPIILNAGGALRSGGTLGIVNGPCTISSTARLIGGVSPYYTLRIGNVGSALSGGPGTLAIVEGPGAVETSVSNNYQGDWRVDSGTLRLVSQNSGLGTGTSPIVVNGGGTLHLSTVNLQRDIALNSGSTLMFSTPGQIYNQVTIASGAAVTMILSTSGTETLGTNPNAITGGADGSTISIDGNTADSILELNQPSNYIGNWDVRGGTVLIDDDANLGPTSNPVTLSGGALQANTDVTVARTVVPNGGTLRSEGESTRLTIASGLGGNGALYTAGTGTVVLQAACSRTSDTQINGAVLRVEDRNALGTDFTGVTQVGLWGSTPGISPTLEIGDVRIFKDVRLESDNATIRGTGGGTGCFGSIEVTPATHGRLETGSSPSDYFTLGVGNIHGGTGDSSLTVAGAGRVVLTTGSSYVGDWFLNSGTLEISVDDRLGAAGNVVHLTGGTLATSNFIATSRSFDTAGGAFAPADGTTLTLNSPLLPTSGALTKLGVGTLDLTVGSSRSGPTTINDGILNVSNSTGSATGSGSVTVANGGMLRGAGFISGAVLNDGAIAPGGSAGILTFEDFYAQSASGSLNIKIGGLTVGTQYDQLDVTGAASLSGTLSLTLVNGFVPQLGDSFVILTCGSRASQFAQVSGISAGPGKFFRVQYNPTNVMLVVSLSGDMNADGQFNASDVDPFVLALADPAAYQQQFSGGDPLFGDMNHDGAINGLDIGPFIACLVNGDCQ